MYSVVTAIRSALLKDRERWVLWAPVFIALGIGGYFQLEFEPPVWLGVVVTVFFMALSWWLRRFYRSGEMGAGIGALSLLILMALGFTAAQIRTQQVVAPVLQKNLSFATVQGQIRQVEHYPSGVRLTLENLQISKVEPHLLPKRIRIRIRGEQPKFEPGNWVKGRASLAPPGAPAIPDGFDFQRHAFFQQIGAFGFAMGTFQVTAKSGDAHEMNLPYWIAQLRDRVTSRILSGLASPEGGIAAALMTGEKRAVAEPILESLRNSGLAHLLAISGLHIGLVAGIVFSGIRMLLVVFPGVALRFPIKKWAAGVAIIAAFLYAMLAGATLPTQRAFLMAAIALVAVVMDRRGISLRSVAWAAVVVLLIQPESLLGASFQMSFAAAAALVAGYEIWASYRNKRLEHKTSTFLPRPVATVCTYVGGVCMTTIVASAATAPFALYHFNQFAEYSLFANLFAVPITALWVMPWAVIGFITMPFGLEPWALMPMGWGIEAIVWIAEMVSSWPGAVTRISSMPTWGIALLALAGSWLFIWRHRWRLLAIPCIAIGLLSVYVVPEVDLIVDGDARLFAVKTDSGHLYVSDPRKARRDRELWLRHFGLRSVVPIHLANLAKNQGQPLRCDLSACIYKKGDIRIVIVKTEAALYEDCWFADLLISLVPIRNRCPASLKIDRFDLWREGTYAISVRNGLIVLKSSSHGRGDRPWVLKRGSKKTGSL